MPNRDRFFQERLANLEQQWLSSLPDVQLSIERAMLRITAMEDVILRAQERAEIAEQRLSDCSGGWQKGLRWISQYE